MSPDVAPIALFGFATATALHAVFALLILRGWRLNGPHRLAEWALAGAVLSSVAWSAMALADQFSDYLLTQQLTQALDWMRLGLWLVFLLGLLKPGLARSPRRPGALALSALAVWLVGASLTAVQMATAGPGPTQLAAWWLMAALVLPVLGLVMVEQLFRNLPESSRWNAKPVCLGLGAIFVFDVVHFSEAVLFGRLDTDASHVRGVVHALALPLLYLASSRRRDWLGRLEVSRRAAFYSASLLLVGGYLLFVAGMGYAVRALGGDWGRAVQLALLSAAVLLGAALMLSGTVRAQVRVFVGKHFFSYRYDYREQWLRFTTMLSSPGATQDVGGLVVRGLADMLESPAGGLWSRNAAGAAFVQTARWNLPASTAVEPVDAVLPRYLQDSGWIIDLDEYRRSPRRYGTLVLPDWLLMDANHWLLIPLAGHEQLLGFVLLARPRAPVPMDWETRDLVKTAGRQAAGFLAQMQATEALLELRKFEAFNRMSAFVVHDLKNIVTQLSLMLKNAQRLHANPEFQQDMLLTVQSSLDKMRRLMLQLREGATPPGTAAGVELEPIVRRLQAMTRGRGRELHCEVLEPLSTRGHEERLERVLGHLVHNALDATSGGGAVWLEVEREAGWVKVKVRDDGIGMTEDFVQTRLFRPFSTTKDSGMGIGMHESLQYVRELGGDIAVQSQPGAGTCITVRLPLFDVQRSSVSIAPDAAEPLRADETSSQA